MQLPTTGDLFLEKYKLHEPLGRGGFAVVYRATDVAVGRLVAIKFLLPDGTGYDAVVASRFLREAQVLANLSDPHTLRLFDYGKAEEGFLYMVTEYIEGTDLRGVLRQRGRLPEPVARHILEQLLNALREAHSAGILHRDLKPANILVYDYLEDPFRVKLIDFGIAKPVGNHTIDSLTRTGNVVGTPRYMSPEHICSHPLEPSADLYCVGLVAYEMFAGEPAIGGKTDKEILIEQLRDEPIALPYLHQASPEFREIVRGLTARRANARFQAAQEVLDLMSGADARAGRALGGPEPEEDGDTIRQITPPPEAKSRTTPTPGAAPRRTSQPPVPATVPDTPTIALNIVVVALGVLLGGGLIMAVLAFLESNDSPPPVASQAEPERAAPAKPQPAAIVSFDAGNVKPTSAIADIVTPPPDYGISASPGCGTPARVKGTQTIARRVSGVERSWTTYVPEDYDHEKKYPVVLVLDRAVATGDPVFREFRDLASIEEFIIVAPRSDDPIESWKQPEDIELVTTALRETKDGFCIDRDRIYAVGQGIGARFLAQDVVCQVPLSAIAAGGMWMRGTKFECSPPSKVPFLYILGREDTYHPEDGGKACNGRKVLSWAEQDRKWMNRYECTGPPREYSRNEHGVCETWSCEQTRFVRCRVDGGYNWKYIGTDLQFLLGSCAMPASPYPYADEIWAFFQREGRPLVSSPKEESSSEE